MTNSAVEIMTIEVEEQIALSRGAALPAKPELTWLRLIDRAAESLIVAALLGELVLVLANVMAKPSPNELPGTRKLNWGACTRTGIRRTAKCKQAA